MGRLLVMVQPSNAPADAGKVDASQPGDPVTGIAVRTQPLPTTDDLVTVTVEGPHDVMRVFALDLDARWG
jgi:hypothetical protein